LSDRTLSRVGLCDSWAVDCCRAWDSTIPERWTTPARGIPRFLSGGPFLRVGFRDSWAVERYRAWDSTISERWTTRAYKYIFW